MPMLCPANVQVVMAKGAASRSGKALLCKDRRTAILPQEKGPLFLGLRGVLLSRHFASCVSHWLHQGAMCTGPFLGSFGFP